MILRFSHFWHRSLVFRWQCLDIAVVAAASGTTAAVPAGRANPFAWICHSFRVKLVQTSFAVFLTATHLFVLRWCCSGGRVELAEVELVCFPTALALVTAAPRTNRYASWRDSSWRQTSNNGVDIEALAETSICNSFVDRNWDCEDKFRTAHDWTWVVIVRAAVAVAVAIRVSFVAISFATVLCIVVWLCRLQRVRWGRRRSVLWLSWRRKLSEVEVRSAPQITYAVTAETFFADFGRGCGSLFRPCIVVVPHGIVWTVPFYGTTLSSVGFAKVGQNGGAGRFRTGNVAVQAELCWKPRFVCSRGRKHTRRGKNLRTSEKHGSLIVVVHRQPPKFHVL
mmetsp:Transcript_14047/g.27262  ORF Transcript_14047/g.27262 Transcript_14047/m.27262 type:complete len:338 (-) Transcript_14047:341-1354(-)